MDPLNCFDRPEFDGHEGVYYFEDTDTGLRAIIAVHSTTLGPAAGGCRRWYYASEAEALTDALRLSRSMSYKNAMAGLPFGGGKAVILDGPTGKPTPEEFRAFGRFVESLKGRYITAEALFGAIPVAPAEILAAEVEVLAPCALGGILNANTIPHLRARIVAGAANNQLASPEDALRLHSRDIVFLPDYVINAGGIISVAREYLGRSTQEETALEVAQIPARLDDLLTRANREDLAPSVFADRIARSLIGRGEANLNSHGSSVA